ncbi:hypothetical protein [Streptomyces silvisoli]|uniref:Uncharacterized protein n=1 Tax=Streptomyces silvisoli TaxID=3034235 RepID=A0ABT5ZES9_9ACTN|nr:hypothetical protein [Streptomyces silvisoli]MDF3288069.1 hypothetical protein [Streptomyces silvisoli]
MPPSIDADRAFPALPQLAALGRFFTVSTGPPPHGARPWAESAPDRRVHCVLR